MIIDSIGDQHAAGLRKTLQPCRDIHPVPKDVVLFNNHITEVNPNAEHNPLLRGDILIALGHIPLDPHRAPNGIDHALELDKEAVAGAFDDSAAVLADLRIDQLPEMGLEPLVRPLLISPHQARVTRHIGGEDRGETADRGHGSPGI